MKTQLELSFLHACQEAVFRQQELVPLLAHHLGVQPEDVFYQWVMPPHCKQSGIVDGTDWEYFFHGWECNLKNTKDGRFLRIDFGPKGRFDTFTGYGVLQFIMTTKAPWREFDELRIFLAEGPPPYSELSGSHAKMVTLADRFEALGLVEVADRELYDLVEKHTYTQHDGSRVVSLPPEFQDYTKRIFWDARVCRRWILSERGNHTANKGVHALE